MARGRRVGVDVERVRPDFDWRPIAARYQTSAEVARIAALPPDTQSVAFFEWWTRSEAYVKACGEGLGAGEAHLRADPDRQWSIVAVDAGPGFAAALAVDGRDVRVEQSLWAGAQPATVGGNPRKFAAGDRTNSSQDNGGQARTTMPSGWTR